MGLKLTSSDIAENTAPALGDWFYSVDISSTSDDASGDSVRVAGAYMGAISASSDFPSSDDFTLYDGMHHYRTDLKMLCYYDLANTQWLSVAEFPVGIEVRTATATAQDINVTRSDYAPWFTRYEATTYVPTTNDGTHNWTVAGVSYSAIGGSGTTVFSFSTSADTHTTYTKHNGTPTTQNPANWSAFYFVFTKNNSPGNLSVYINAFYRLIVT